MRSERITNRDFFTCEAPELAKKLIGKIICNKVENQKILRFRIVETEAYGKDDTACHSNKYKSGNGVTAQKKIGGTIYVHYNNKKNPEKERPGSMFDIVSNKVGIGEGVLIRGGINIDDPHEKYLSKPICLGEALKIDYEKLNCVDLLTSDLIWIENDGFDTEGKIETGKRIGLDSSKDVKQEDKDKLWRFFLKQ